MKSTRVLVALSSLAVSLALAGCASTVDGDYAVSSISRRDTTNANVAGACVGFAPSSLPRMMRVRVQSRSASGGAVADLLVDGNVACRAHFRAVDYNLFQIDRLEGCEAIAPTGTRFVRGLIWGDPLSTMTLSWMRSSDPSADRACQVEDTITLAR
ncbi:MAG: hypothetical protein JNK05_14100 [Myxococcales bacterium]|nr:hypothetical protein [Myxococcales bacterium]